MNCAFLGNRIRELRRSMHITQEELGKALGVSMQAVSKWECGGSPDIELLPAIADFFGMTIDALFGRTNVKDALLEDKVYQDMLHTRPEQRMEHACKLGWAIFRGLSGLSAADCYPYGRMNDGIANCALARISSNEGLAFAAGMEEYHYFMVMPEPKGGFDAILNSAEEYQKLFELLGKPNRIRLLFFLSSRAGTLFSSGLVKQALGISEKETLEMLKEFEAYGWICEEYMDMEDGQVTVYRSNENKALIPMLTFAGEFMTNIRLWYLSSHTRSRPLLGDKAGSREEHKEKSSRRGVYNTERSKAEVY